MMIAGIIGQLALSTNESEIHAPPAVVVDDDPSKRKVLLFQLFTQNQDYMYFSLFSFVSNHHKGNGIGTAVASVLSGVCHVSFTTFMTIPQNTSDAPVDAPVPAARNAAIEQLEREVVNLMCVQHNIDNYQRRAEAAKAEREKLAEVCSTYSITNINFITVIILSLIGTISAAAGRVREKHQHAICSRADKFSNTQTHTSTRASHTPHHHYDDDDGLSHHPPC